MALLATALLAAACTVVGSNELQLGERAACTSDFGAYYLPKHLVTIALKRGQGDRAWTDDGKAAYYLAKFHPVNGGTKQPSLREDKGEDAPGRFINVEARPDPDFGFCLDYSASPSAKDRLIVDRDKMGLLTSVATKGNFYKAPGEADVGSTGETFEESENQTDLIARRIIQATFTGIGRRQVRSCDDPAKANDADFVAYCDCLRSKKKAECISKFGESRPVQHRGGFADLPASGRQVSGPRLIEDRHDIAFNVDFDPTDPFEMTEINKSLISYGHCAFLGDGKVDLMQVQSYCNDPGAYAQSRGFRRRTAKTGGSQRAHPFRSYKGGVLYRPRVSYPFYIFRREGKTWQLIEQEKVELANRGPVVSVGVDRAIFASRNTEFAFKEGSLESVVIDKKSELEAFAGIPLAIVTNIVKLPSQVLLLKIDQTTSTSELVAVNTAIINAQAEYNRVLAELTRAEAEVAAVGPPGAVAAAQAPDRRSKLLNACETVLKTQGGVPGKQPASTCRDIVDQSFNQ